MGTVILIGTVAIIVAIVGCFGIWRLDASRADEIEHQTPPSPRPQLGVVPARTAPSTPPRHIGS
ncbi:hypothetical protein GCM10009641_33520 [Mycobacterium cookii]|uniref:Uncharacterized protein n=1 Tax=Nocardioides furvisabuli TaxID=375542 RepID=A0ABN2WXF5_9ACTN|nr:hypothetical protein [Nocardioides furvisabuli]